MTKYAWARTVPKVPRNQIRFRTGSYGVPSKEQRLAIEHGGGYASVFAQESYSGRRVDMATAMQHSVVWACIRQTAQTIASLPMALILKAPDGSRRPFEERIAEVISSRPNAEQTGMEHWEGQAAWLLANGNCYAEKVYSGRELSQLLPLAASHCEPVRAADGTLSYAFQDRGQKETLPADKVLHVRGFGFGGMKGLSAIHFGLQSLGAALAADETAARFFGGGMTPSGVFKTPDTLSVEQRAQAREMMTAYAGSRNAGKAMLLEGGFEYQQVTLNPEDAQMLDTRRFAVEDICRWFGTPPIVIGHAGQGQTMWGSGVEQILMSWLSQGLNPLMRRIEARIRRDLLSVQYPRVYAEWNREGILQMESKAKAEFLKTLVNSGLMTPNEAREKLNLPRVEGGDSLLIQGAMVTLDQLTAQAGQVARTEETQR